MPLSTPIDEVADNDRCSREQALAHDMIEVHGAEAATVARNNARSAALAARLPEAKSWIRLVALIQRQQADKKTLPDGPDRSCSTRAD